MRNYTNKISLVRNSRGCWDLDPFKGCEDGVSRNPNGCYGLCYAAKIAQRRGYDFSKTAYRGFISENHFENICRKIERERPIFIRMGVMCDPSHDWSHSLGIANRIKDRVPWVEIVIVTKHWKPLKSCQLGKLRGLIVNTSVSALDSQGEIKKRMFWYRKLKKYCKSVLRVNTADFNDKKLKEIQERLLGNDYVINNILRIPKSHPLVINKTLNISKRSFLKSSVYASVYDDSVFFGMCNQCPDKCGVGLI